VRAEAKVATCLVAGSSVNSPAIDRYRNDLSAISTIVAIVAIIWKPALKKKLEFRVDRYVLP